MSRICLFSLDVEEDLVEGKSVEKFQGVEQLPLLLPLVKKYSLHPTLFCTGRVIEKYTDVLKQFEQDGEIALHGFFDHVNMQLQTVEDRKQKLQNHKKLFQENLGYSPLGFRAVQNTIDESGLNLLVSQDFKYDSSIVSRYVPFKHYVGYTGRAPRAPYFPQAKNILKRGDNTILEIPLSPLLLGVQLQGKWIQGLGSKVYKNLLRVYKPEFLSFSFHSWDLFSEMSGEPNHHFLTQLEEIVVLLKKHNYSFLSAKEIYEQVSHNR